MSTSTESISSLPYNKLYERLFDHHSNKKTDTHYYNVLLLAAIVGCIAMDTSICERGFSLINLLKTARRSRMGDELLRILMTICSLGEEWKDPTKIPVKEIIEEWRSQSTREGATRQQCGRRPVWHGASPSELCSRHGSRVGVR